MLKMKQIVRPYSGETIDTLWELFPEGDAGTFIFYVEGITVDFKRVGDEYHFEMLVGKKRVAYAKQSVGKSLIAHVDSRYYVFVHGMARDVQLI